MSSYHFAGQTCQTHTNTQMWHNDHEKILGMCMCSVIVWLLNISKPTQVTHPGSAQWKVVWNLVQFYFTQLTNLMPFYFINRYLSTIEKYI